jgi:signal transduction histidine kinase
VPPDLASFPRLNPDPIIEISMDKKITFFNAACTTTLKKLGLPETPAAFLPPDIDAIIQSRDIGESAVFYREVPVGEALFGETLYFSPDGRSLWIYAHDMTDRILTTYALEQANRKLNLLSGIVRHDIKNKLTSVLGYLDLVKGSTDDPTLLDYLGRVETSASAIRYQIEFTKEYENLGINVPLWQEVSLVVNEVKKQCNLQTVALDDASAGITIFADPLFKKVIYSLIDNSLGHGGHVTRIRIYGRQKQEELVIIYEDDGIGIPEEMKEKIFTPNIEKSRGFGLFLAREILSITGITIAETGEPGKGARFEMLVPKCRYRTMQKGE